MNKMKNGPGDIKRTCLHLDYTPSLPWSHHAATRYNSVTWCWFACKWDAANRVTWSTFSAVDLRTVALAHSVETF